MKNRRMTKPKRKVLEALLDDASESGLSGADLMKQTGISSGTLYPMLHRFEQDGLIRSARENIDPSELGRPRRVFYRIAPGERLQILDWLSATGLFRFNEVTS